MHRSTKAFSKALILLVPFLCTSCLSTSLPKSAKVDAGSPVSESPVRLETKGAIDRGLVDTWELLYLVDDKGEETRPREHTRTLIEFTDKGQVIFNRLARDNADETKSRTGKYTIERDQILITDDVGNSSKWPYQLAGDTLVIAMPESNKKFFWRRFR